MRWFGVTILGALLWLPLPARADIVINISKAQQQLTVSIDGAETYRWPVSTGKPGYDTPSGRFTAFRTEQVYFSKKYDDAPMPNAVFFHEGYAVHGTLEQGRLGNAVSHGCVRLSQANAATLFALVKQRGMSHTRIVVSDGPLSSRYASAPPAVSQSALQTFRQQTRTEPARYARQDRGFERWSEPRVNRAAPRRTVQYSGDRDPSLRATYRKYGFTW